MQDNVKFIAIITYTSTKFPIDTFKVVNDIYKEILQVLGIRVHDFVQNENNDIAIYYVQLDIHIYLNHSKHRN